MMFLHGFGATPRVWDVLDGDAFGADVPPLAGHGGPAASDFDVEVDRLAARIEQPTTVAGYSLGGRMALGLACRHPYKVSRLILIGTHPGLDGPDARLRRIAEDDALADDLERRGLDRFFAEWDARPLFAKRRPPCRDGLEARSLARAMRSFSLGRMPSRWLGLSRLPMPVCWVAGSLDAKFLHLAHQAAKHSPLARVVEVDGADHDVLSCEPQLVRRLIELAPMPLESRA